MAKTCLLEELVEIGHLQLTAIEYRGSIYSPALLKSYKRTIDEIQKLTQETESIAINLVECGRLHS